MDRKKNYTGKELDEGIHKNLQSILQWINAYFNYGTPILWIQYSKWSIGDTGEDLVTNAHANDRNLSHDITGRCDVKISQPKTKVEWISSRLLGEV